MIDLLSISDISQKLGIPQSTLRYYRDIFREYLPSRGEGKKKRFFKEAVEVFAVIAKGMQQNKPAAEISAELDLKFTRVIDINDKLNEINKNNLSTRNIIYKYAAPVGKQQNNNNSQPSAQKRQSAQLPVLNSDGVIDKDTFLSAINNQNKAIKEVAATVHMVSQHQLEIKNLKEELSKLEEQVENQLTRHFQLIDFKLQQTLEKNAKKNKSKSFWQRIFD